jgi:hypothetical protein
MTHTTGGREKGASRSSDGRLDVKLSLPGSAQHQSGAAVRRRMVGLFRKRDWVDGSQKEDQSAG